MRKLLGLVLLLALVAPSAAHAQVTPILTITPAVGEVSVAPGDSASETVTLSNGGAEPLSVLAAVGDVAPTGNGFTLKSPGSQADSAAAWVTVTPSGAEIPAAGSAIVTITIRAPAGVQVGEHAAGILFSAKDKAQAAHTLLVTVTGTGLNRDATVDAIKMPKFETQGTIKFELSATNNGNTHAVLHGTIEIRDRLRRSTTNIAIPSLYVLPGGPRTFTIEWKDPPPLLFAHVEAHVAIRYESVSGTGFSKSVVTSGVAIVFWALLLVIALVFLIVRLAIALVSRKRRRRRKEKTARAPEQVVLPPAVAGQPAPVRRSVWEEEHEHSTAAGAIAVRRATAALKMLKAGAGKSGVRADVAIGLLRSVAELPEVRAAVESAYSDATPREATALSLALAVVDSPRAPEALLHAFGKADRVLAARIRQALAQCDPADLRQFPELLEALPQTRRSALPVA